MQRRVVLLSRELTESQVDRQNILNNTYALKKTEELLPLGGYFWRKTYWFTKSDVATLFNVDIRTITLYLTNYEIELKNNGYHVLKGKDLKEFREYFAKEIDLPTKTTNLAVFNYRSVLNIAMLLAESEKAKEIRTKILDIVPEIGTIGLKIPVSLGNPFLKKSSGFTGAVINISSLNKTKCSERSGNFEMLISITFELKVGRYSSLI